MEACGVEGCARREAQHGCVVRAAAKAGGAQQVRASWAGVGVGYKMGWIDVPSGKQGALAGN